MRNGKSCAMEQICFRIFPRTRRTIEVNESDDEDHRWSALGPDGPGQFLLLLD